MSYIHGSNYQPICTEHEYMRLLFSATYSYLFMDTFKLQLGAIYCLLMIWVSQPLKPRYPIPISLYLWKHINTLLAKDFPGVDGGRAAFVHLVENKALLFAATVELLPPPQAWPKNRHQLPVELRKADTLTGVLDLKVLEEQENLYEKRKAVAQMPLNHFPLTQEITTIVNETSRHSVEERTLLEGELFFQEQTLRLAALERVRQVERRREQLDQEIYQQVDDGIILVDQEEDEDEIIPNAWDEELPDGDDDVFEGMSDGEDSDLN